MSKNLMSLPIYDIVINPPPIIKNGDNNSKKSLNQSSSSKNFQNYQQKIYLNQAEMIKESYDQNNND